MADFMVLISTATSAFVVGLLRANAQKSAQDSRLTSLMDKLDTVSAAAEAVDDLGAS
jgi:hypothetical protein